MAISNNLKFGNRTNNIAKTDERTKAEYWVNIGYESSHQDEDGTYRFVSLSQGIPLDTIDDLPINSRNSDFADFQSARNDLRAQLMEVASQLAPGEATYVATDTSTGLAIQIRRVNGEVTVSAPGENKFSRKLKFIA